MFACAWRHRELVRALAWREVLSRYRGSMLGMLWTVLNPLLLLAAFTFVFSSVFEARWNVPVERRADFALVLFAGLVVFWFFSDCVSRAPGLLLENASYVKRVVFPLETLAWGVLLAALFHAGLAALVLLGAHVVLAGLPPWTALLAPLVLLPVALVALGVCWFLSALGVYLRDVGQLVPAALTLLLFLTPIFYPLAAVPESFRPWLALNPLAHATEAMRGALLFGRAPALGPLALATAGGWLVAWLGLLWFRRTRPGFADVV